VGARPGAAGDEPECGECGAPNRGVKVEPDPAGQVAGGVWVSVRLGGHWGFSLAIMLGAPTLIRRQGAQDDRHGPMMPPDAPT